MINTDVVYQPHFQMLVIHHSLSAVRLLTVPPTLKALAKLPLASAPVTTLAVTTLARELVTAQDPLSNATQAEAVGVAGAMGAKELAKPAMKIATAKAGGAVETKEFV
ncbi:MAG TPA: hypothetical protein PKK96_11160 [Anaerolineales bacterium]|nr:hypothetical protein [Anaerolineales bacterium]HNQ95077.1 hypothetical protein [Anaerolineales bacterium]HNS61553.1 hypothetical protein [Anaerolineales bacterium]